jgi:hypothetical protein
MGKVNFSTYVRVAGCYEPYENIYAFVYCDKCGSFSLESHTLPYTNTQIVVQATAIVGTLLVSGIAWWFTHSWILCAVATGIGGLIFMTHGRTTLLVCKKCGNEVITSANVRGYAANDASLLDVPDESVIKEYLHSIIPAM